MVCVLTRFIVLATTLFFTQVSFLLAESVRVSHQQDQCPASAIIDKKVPENSRARPTHSFGRRGTREWAEYHFDAPREVDQTWIYWFSDRPDGFTGLPVDWDLFYRDGDKWVPIDKPARFAIDADRFNRVTFKPVKADAFRMEIQLQHYHSVGILEWDFCDDPTINGCR
jgi:uncharacterized protein